VSVDEQAASLPLPPGARNGAAATRPNADEPMRRALLAFGAYYLSIAVFLFWMETIVPDRISVTFFGQVHSASHIHHHIVVAGLLGFVVVPTAFLIELLLNGWPDSSLRHLLVVRSRSSRSDLVVFLLWQAHAMNVVRSVLTFGIAPISGLWVHGQLLALTGFDLGVSWMPSALGFAVYLLLFTFFDYWTHRLDHTRYFWPIHRYHHSAEEFYVITSDRGSPGTITAAVVTTMPLGILGMTPEIAFWIYVLVGAEHLVIHSRIDSDFGWIGRYVVQSPVHHRLHHGLDTSRPVAHFSLLPIWDHLFGTWQGGGSQKMPIGVDYPYRHGLWVLPDLWRDYCELIAGFFRRSPG